MSSDVCNLRIWLYLHSVGAVMFSVQRYNGDDVSSGAGDASEQSSALSGILDKAKERNKRKRQEETFTKRAKTEVAEAAAKKQQQKKKKKEPAPLRPLRSETLEERNDRKAAAKAARKDRRAGGAAASGMKGETPTPSKVEKEKSTGKKTVPIVAPGDEEETPVDDDSTGVGQDNDEPVAAVTATPSPTESTDTEGPTSSAPSATAAFVEQLTREQNGTIKRATRIDDEDDEAMDVFQAVTPAPPPISVGESMEQ